MIRWRVLVCAILACGLAAIAGCSPAAETEEQAPESVAAVHVARVETRVFQDSVSASGQWRSSGEIPIVAPSASVVESIEPRIGDHVRAGATLAWLVTRESHAALEGALLLEQRARDEMGRDEARRAVALARRDLVRVPLKAPRDGVVIRRAVEPGSQVAESTEILALVAPGSVVFEAHVAQKDASRVRPGEPAIVVEQGRAPTATRVSRVLPAASESDQAVLVWLVPNSPSAAPPLQEFGTARIVVGAARRALAVPDTAVVEDDLTGESRVARVVRGRAIWTPVMLGSAAAGWRELRNRALAEGDSVVVQGQRGLPDSTRVTPESPTAPATEPVSGSR